MTQPPQPQAPTGTLDLTLQGNVLISLITPTVRVNGYRVPAGYGPNQIPVYAGATRVDVECQWLWTYGRTSLQLDVDPGETVPVFYANPWMAWSPGRIGHTPQKHAGLVWLLLIVGLVFGLPLLTAIL